MSVELEDIDDEVIPRQPFTSEQLNFFLNLSLSEYRVHLINWVWRSRLSKKAKETLENTINGFYDRTVFLANIPNEKVLREVIIDLKRALNRFKFSCTKKDVSLPEFAHMMVMIENHLLIILSRATGAERERLLQAKTMIEKKTMVEEGKKEVKEKQGMRIRNPFSRYSWR
jgi:hypothetical protein